MTKEWEIIVASHNILTHYRRSGDSDRDGGRDANLSRFSGSSSISSADYFGREEVPYHSRGGAAGLQAPDMEDVKDSVRQGVSKVAGRLSNVASGVMTQLQVINNRRPQ